MILRRMYRQRAILLGILMLLASCARDIQNDPKLPIAVETLVSPTNAATHSTDLLPIVTPTVMLQSLNEYLLFWGTDHVMEDRCQVTSININTLQAHETVINDFYCRFEIVEINNKIYLVQAIWYNPEIASELTSIQVFDVSDNGELILVQSIPLGHIRLTATPQWGKDGTIYFSGILNGREQIYRIEPETDNIESYIDYSGNGFASEPIISPDGRYIAYRVWENHNSHDDCGQLTCYNNYYYLWDTQARVAIPLRPQIQPLQLGEPYFLHCSLSWSPNGQYIAFVIGCSLQRPGSVVVFDVIGKKPVTVINSTKAGPYGDILKFEWLDENRLVLKGSVALLDNDSSYDGYFVYSANEDSFAIWPHLSERNKWNTDIVSFSDWTNEGEYALGQTQVPGDRRTVNLVVMDTNNPTAPGYYFPVDETNVQWAKFSPSDSWIAYVSYESQNTFSRVTILDRDGVLLYDSGMISLAELTASWLVHD